jgi:hypothetical protein
MPDKDVFDRRLAKGWRSVARCIYHGFDPKDVAHRVTIALRKDLQALCGFPGWEELYDFLAVSAKGSPEATLKIFDKAKSFERITDDRDLASVLTKTFRQTYIEITEGRKQSDGRNRIGFELPSQKDFVKNLCENFLDNRLHSRVDMIERSSQDGGHWSNPSYRQAYFQELDPSLEIIAETFVRDPNFIKPPSFHHYHRVRQTTEELMHAPLELMEE